MKTTHELICTLFNHCLHTFRHSIRVGSELYSFGCYLGIDNPEQLFLLGDFHDIGKIHIDPSLLNKVEPLTQQEFDEIKRHTLYGEQMIKKIKEFPPNFSKVILYHHENINGTGYYGLKGEEIPLLSRMIRIIDTFDTMLYGRIYQKPIRQDEVIQEIFSLRDKYYDRNLVEAFEKFINKKYADSSNMVLENRF